MNEKQFAELKDAIGMMARHARGEQVAGMRVTEIPDTDVKVIREGANISQSEFAPTSGSTRTPPNREVPSYSDAS